MSAGSSSSAPMRRATASPDGSPIAWPRCEVARGERVVGLVVHVARDLRRAGRSGSRAGGRPSASPAAPAACRAGRTAAPSRSRARAAPAPKPIRSGNIATAPLSRVDPVAVADLAVAVAEGRVGELERDVRLARRTRSSAGPRRASSVVSSCADQRRAGSRAAGSTGSATSSRAAPRRTSRPRRHAVLAQAIDQQVVQRGGTRRGAGSRTGGRRCAGRRSARCPRGCAGRRWPPGAEQQLRRVVALVEVWAADRPAAVDALEVERAACGSCGSVSASACDAVAASGRR